MVLSASATERSVSDRNPVKSGEAGMGMSDFPCWLSGRDAAIAIALIEKAGFIYCGRAEDFIPLDEEIGTGY